MEVQRYLYKCPNHGANLNKMRLNNKGCDVTIRVEDKELRGHKVVLAANLKYFESMFFSSFQESDQDVITMTGLMGTDLEAFITYAYTGEMLLTESNALNLLEVANYLSEDDVKEACIEFLKRNLKEDNACRVYKFASAIDCPLLQHISKSIISSNFENCSQLAEYLELDHENLIDILSDKKAQPYSQTQQLLFEGIMRWITHDAKNRKIYTKYLINCIDITKLSAEYFMDYLANLAYHTDGSGIIEDIMFCYYTSRIDKKKNAQVLMILGNVDAKPHFQFYDFVERKWSELYEIPGVVGNINSNCAVLNDKLYYISENSKRFSLQVFDPMKRRNTTLHSLSNILGWSSMCADDRFIYLCGGVLEDDSRSEQVLKYDPETNSFETLTPMGTKRSSASATFYEGCLHVLGGFNGSLKLDSVEKYDPDTKEWTALESICMTRYRHATAVLCGKLYACGGYIRGDGAEVYDPVKMNWRTASGMIEPRDDFLLVPFEGRLLAVGGDKDITVEVYDPRKNRWQICDDLSFRLMIKYPRGGLISVSCVDNIPFE